MAAAPVPPYHSWSAPTSVNGSPDASPTRMKTSSLQTQIEFYFSPQNLTSDAYLRSQMDEERFVPIAVIAEFKLVKKITTDTDLIVEAIRRSKLLELDEATIKVRASLKATERQTLILRDIPADTPVEQIRAIFDNEKCDEVVSIRPDIGDTWFVTFRDEESCMRTAEYLSDVTFGDRPIRFRVKSENQTRSFHQEKVLPPPYIPMVMYPGSTGRAPSWNIRKAPLFPGDTTGVFMPSMMMNRRPAAPPTPEDRRKPVVRKPRDGNVQPGSSTPNGLSRQIRRQRQIRSVPFPMRRDEGCVDGVTPTSQPQPDLGLEHFPALPSSARTPVLSCPPSPSKDKSYAETAIEDPFAYLFLDSPPAGGQAAPASTSPSSAIDEYRNETDVVDKTVSYASIARRAAESKPLSD